MFETMCGPDSWEVPTESSLWLGFQGNPCFDLLPLREKDIVRYVELAVRWHSDTADAMIDLLPWHVKLWFRNRAPESQS